MGRLSRRHMLVALTAGAAFGALPGVAFAQDADPVPGVNVNLGQNPGMTNVVTGQTDRSGAAVFRNLPPGNYSVLLDRTQFTQPVVVVIERPGMESVTSEPIEPAQGRPINMPVPGINIVVAPPARRGGAPVTVRVVTAVNALHRPTHPR